MTEENPYTAPSTDPIVAPPVTGQLQLATPSDRFLGAFIDGLIGLVIAAPFWGLLFLVGVIHRMEDMGNLGFVYTLLFTIFYFIAFMAIQWKFLKSTGQSIGKKVAKTRIVTMDGKKPFIGDLVGKRYAFVSLISVVPVVGGILSLVDALMVFKSDRRCLHDLVAGTQVVKFPPGEIIS
jgi:uncharacterized RDD family membrane protein YckC